MPNQPFQVPTGIFDDQIVSPTRTLARERKRLWSASCVLQELQYQGCYRMSFSSGGGVGGAFAVAAGDGAGDDADVEEPSRATVLH